MATGNALGQVYGGAVFSRLHFVGPYMVTGFINLFAFILSVVAFRKVTISRTSLSTLTLLYLPCSVKQHN
jgi:predicted MFS family arabinose efflux permease